MVETPILFITFVRPEYARKTFDAIKSAKPKKLYFYSNKGRIDKNGEVERNNQIRSYINEIDWPCELHTWFREECVNVYDSLRGAISWLFENEDQGIILEEDCVPTMGFFSYVDKMIQMFRYEYDVWYISGDNPFNLNPSGYEYIYSRYHLMYGWATWRDRWQKIEWGDFGIDNILEKKICNELFKKKSQAREREQHIMNCRDFLLQTNCWDYAFGFTVDNNRGVGVYPIKHLVHNIGLSGQHHEDEEESFVNRAPLCNEAVYNISECREVSCDLEFDYQFYKLMMRERSLWRQLKFYIKHPCLFVERALAKLKRMFVR